MIVALFVLVPIAGMTIWAFFRYAPARGQPRALRRFNSGAVVAAFLIAAAWSVRTYIVMSPTEDAAWWPVISLLGALAIVPVVLGIAAVIRTLFGMKG
jgi:hypothetical protein